METTYLDALFQKKSDSPLTQAIIALEQFRVLAEIHVKKSNNSERMLSYSRSLDSRCAQKASSLFSAKEIKYLDADIQEILNSIFAYRFYGPTDSMMLREIDAKLNKLRQESPTEVLYRFPRRKGTAAIRTAQECAIEDECVPNFPSIPEDCSDTYAYEIADWCASARNVLKQQEKSMLDRQTLAKMQSSRTYL